MAAQLEQKSLVSRQSHPEAAEKRLESLQHPGSVRLSKGLTQPRGGSFCRKPFLPAEA